MTPELFTDRLHLRAYRLEDFPLCLALWGDPVVTRFIGGKPSTEEEAWARFVRYPGHWALMGYGQFAAFDRETGAFVGEMGVFDAKRPLEPAFTGAPEAGWVLSPAFFGRGLAVEGVSAVLAWCDGRGFARTVCMIDQDHVASQTVAARCGFRTLADTTYRDAPVRLFERLHP